MKRAARTRSNNPRAQTEGSKRSHDANSEQGSSTNFSMLPEDVVLLVLLSCDVEDLFSFRKVSTALLRVAGP